MSTRTCKKCGWVFPATQKGNVCPICREPFDEVVCYKCGRLVSGNDRVPGRPICKACHNADEQKHMVEYRKRHYQSFNDRYNEWLSKIAQVPKDYPTLTEAQWLETCRHFRGCARCHSDEIDTRGYFIGRESGGRYCDWNILPLCEKCAVVWNLNLNPFSYAEHKDHSKHSNSTEYRECLEQIVEYLGGKLDAARRHDSNTE